MSRLRFIIVAYMLIALVGQSFAYAKPMINCDMSMMNMDHPVGKQSSKTPSQDDQAETEFDHSYHQTLKEQTHNQQTHNHSNMNHSDLGGIDESDSALSDSVSASADESITMMDHSECCGDSCDCPTSACSSFSLVPPVAFLDAELNTVQRTGFIKNQPLPKIISTLYRPPIIA